MPARRSYTPTKPTKWRRWWKKFMERLDYEFTKRTWEGTTGQRWTRLPKQSYTKNIQKDRRRSSTSLPAIESPPPPTTYHTQPQTAYHAPPVYTSQSGQTQPPPTSTETQPVFSRVRFTRNPNLYAGKVPAYLKKGANWEKEHNRFVKMRQAARKRKKKMFQEDGRLELRERIKQQNRNQAPTVRIEQAPSERLPIQPTRRVRWRKIVLNKSK